jgi:hypothetical protein
MLKVHVPSPCPQSMFAAHACSPNFKFKSHAINGKAANNTLEEIDELTDEQLVYEPDDEVADEAKTEDAAPTQPCEGLLRLKYVTVLCGWATHGIFCNCSGETVELPMPATDSNGTVQCVLPIKTMKSAEIEQEEYDEFYESTGETVELPMPATTSARKVRCILHIRTMQSAEIEQEEYDEFYKSTANNKYGKSAENTKSLSLDKDSVDSDDQLLVISKEILQQHLLQMINQRMTLKITQGPPLIREMLWRVEDNPTDKSVSDMASMMFDTATHKSVNPLNVTINPAHKIEAMMRQTPETDANEMIDEEEEVPDEEPPEDHVNKNEGEMAPLDALYPKIRVPSNDEEQQTLHRMSNMPESTYVLPGGREERDLQGGQEQCQDRGGGDSATGRFVSYDTRSL